jgi:hypothetical protein
MTAPIVHESSTAEGMDALHAKPFVAARRIAQHLPGEKKGAARGGSFRKGIAVA